MSFLLISYSHPHRLFLCFSTSSLSLLVLILVQLTALSSLSLILPVFVAERRALHNDTAGRDAAWHRCRDEVPVRHELRPPRPRRTEYPGEQQLGLQGFRLWAVALSG